jgi:hypothetical protein
LLFAVAPENGTMALEGEFSWLVIEKDGHDENVEKGRLWHTNSMESNTKKPLHISMNGDGS